MTTVAELVDEAVRAGGILRLEGDSVKVILPKDKMHLVDELRAHKPEVRELLHKSGGRIANFPRCPACRSWALFRENNRGLYECLTCTQQDIPEHVARRVM